MPDSSVVHAHLHLRDTERLPWPTLGATLGLNRTFGAAELRRDTEGVAIDGFVYVQGEVPPPFAQLGAQWVAGLGPCARLLEPRRRGSARTV